MKKWLLLVPLPVLSVALWLVNEKRLHPTQSKIDFFERARLKRADSIHILLDGRNRWIEKARWARFIDELFLVPSQQPAWSNTRWVFFDAEYVNGHIRPVGHRFIQYDPCSHSATYDTFVDGVWCTLKLHPHSLRALEELLSERPEDSDAIEWMRPFHGCP
jgi:hypothetical protein